MTNMLPQAPSLNRGPWKSVETFEQNEATAGRELYIIAGAFGTGGTGSNGRKTSLARGKVNVPKTFWKVLVILARGNNDLDRIDANTRTIAICMPNTQSVRGRNWRTFITTIRNVETAHAEWLSRGSPKGGKCYGGPKPDPSACKEPVPIRRRAPGPTMDELRMRELSAREMEMFWKKVMVGSVVGGTVVVAGPAGIAALLRWLAGAGAATTPAYVR